MKILYGSQNLGYSKKDSDKDWIEIIYPTWKDIVQDKLIVSEDIDRDGIHTKVYDIRFLNTLFISSHFATMQILYSTEYIDAEDLDWFIQNRQRISKCNLYKCYTSNSGNMISNLQKHPTSKTLTQAYTFYKLLEQILLDDEFKMLNRETLNFRLWAEELSPQKLSLECDNMISQLKDLRVKFEKYKDKLDNDILDQVEAEIIRLLKIRLLKEN